MVGAEGDDGSGHGVTFHGSSRRVIQDSRLFDPLSKVGTLTLDSPSVPESADREVQHVWLVRLESIIGARDPDPNM